MNAVVDFRRGQPVDHAPADLEAEQALLGILLYENEAIHTLEGMTAERFREPFHQRLFATIAAAIGKGRLAEPIDLAAKFSGDAAFEDLGGGSYLALLVERAPPTNMAAHFGQVISEAAQRRALMELAENMSAAAKSGEMEAPEIIGLAESSLLAMQVTSRPMQLVSVADASASVLAYLDAPEEEVSGIRTGLAPLDEELGPLLPGNLVLLMGRPSMGKSAAAECIALNIAEQGYGVIQINGEMSPEEMVQRHLTDICQRLYAGRGPEYRDIRRRRIGYDQRQMLTRADELLRPLPMKMIKRPGLKLSQLRSLARRQAAAWARMDIPLGAVIVDHVGLLHPDQSNRDRYADQTIVSNTMKELADELGCPVIGLNQMNRQNENREDKRPQLSDLRDSGSWEQDADFVIGFYREAYYAQRQAEPKKELELAEWLRAKNSRTIEAIILKARAGACSTVNLWGDVARNAIRGVAPEYGDLM